MAEIKTEYETVRFERDWCHVIEGWSCLRSDGVKCGVALRPYFTAHHFVWEQIPGVYVDLSELRDIAAFLDQLNGEK